MSVRPSRSLRFPGVALGWLLSIILVLVIRRLVILNWRGLFTRYFQYIRNSRTHGCTGPWPTTGHLGTPCIAPSAAHEGRCSSRRTPCIAPSVAHEGRCPSRHTPCIAPSVCRAGKFRPRTLQHNAAQCSTMQHNATQCSTMQHNALSAMR